jgi:hypothetical protein
MDDRTRALTEIAALARRHGLSVEEIADALGRTPHDAGDARRRGILVRILGYLGGTFVFAGIGVFIALQWEYMNPAGRVIITLGSGLAAFVMAIAASREPRFEKATTPLLLMSAALVPTGMLVAFDEFGTGGDWRWASLVTGATTALQFGAAYRVLRRSTPLFVAVLFALVFWWTALDLLDVDGTLIALLLGGCVVLAAAGIDRMGHADITPAFYFAGAASFLWGWFDAVEGHWVEISFLAAAAGFVYLSAVLHSRMLLTVATLAILSYTGWFTSRHFADSIGWPIALIAFGLFMIGLSALAFRFDREYVRRPG